MGARLAKRVLLIGWDAADWKVINPLLDAGKMPAVEFVINRGVMGNLATLRPILSPMLWNSIATGKRPDKHGICGFSEPDPHTGGARPVTSTSRKVKAIWNILTQRGFKTHQIGWYASHPAEPINGISISDRYTVATSMPGQPWPTPAGTIQPESKAESFARLRMHPGDVLPEMLLTFVPRAADVDQKKDRRLFTLAKILAETSTIHNAATWILEHEVWDFLAVFYSGIDHFSHAFMNFHPPKLETVTDEQFELYKDVLAGGYRLHDMMLARLLELVGPETTVVLVSDHGFHSDHLRPLGIPKEPAGPAVQHRPTGIFVMMGDGVRQDARIDGATLLDVTPTILTLFGLPVGEDMDGRVLLQAFEDRPLVDRIPSWECEPGDCGMHSEELRTDAESSRAVLEQFVALGYIEAPGEDQKKAAETAVREQKYNLARVYLFSRRPEQATPLLEDLASAYPEEERFARHLAQCYVLLERQDEAERVLTPLLQGEEATNAMANWLRGELHFERGETEAALEALLRAEQLDPQLPDLHIRIARTYLRRAQTDDADRALAKALRIDPDSAEAHLWMARVRLRQRRDAEAAEEALNAVGLEHFLPLGHFFLGVALSRLRHFRRAIQAFETVLNMAPGFAPAHRWLARVHSRPRGDKDRARQHVDWLRERRQHRRAAAVAAS